MSTYFSVYSRGVNALRASETIAASNLVQISLPPNQWMTEVSS